MGMDRTISNFIRALRNADVRVSTAETLDAMLSEARALWDAKALRDCIIKDQNRRRLINRSHKIGSSPVWDYQPYKDASKQYVRAGKWTTEVEAKAHLDKPRSRD